MLYLFSATATNSLNLINVKLCLMKEVFRLFNNAFAVEAKRAFNLRVTHVKIFIFMSYCNLPDHMFLRFNDVWNSVKTMNSSYKCMLSHYVRHSVNLLIWQPIPKGFF